MCFSAGASFCASALLAFFGILALRSVAAPRQIALASIPFLFALQQAAEGIVWLAQLNPAGLLHLGAAYVFLTFAFIIWPILLPTSLWLLERNPQRKIALLFCIEVGIFVSFFSFLQLLFYRLTVEVLEHHISYSLASPEITGYESVLLYLAAAVLPFFITSMNFVWVYGLSALIFYFISITYWSCAYVSVWCFFAALLSLLIYRNLVYLNTLEK